MQMMGRVTKHHLIYNLGVFFQSADFNIKENKKYEN